MKLGRKLWLQQFQIGMKTYNNGLLKLLLTDSYLQYTINKKELINKLEISHLMELYLQFLPNKDILLSLVWKHIRYFYMLNIPRDIINIMTDLCVRY